MRIVLPYLLFVLSTIWSGGELLAQEASFLRNETLRIDLVLSGNYSRQSAYIHRLQRYSGRFGSARQDCSPFDYGEYRYFLLHPVSGDTLFQRGFSTLFEEWRTTDEAREKQRAFQQTIEMPMPAEPVELRIESRRRDGTFFALLSESIDPEDPAVGHFIPEQHPYRTLHGGEQGERLDLLILAEGYRSEEQALFYQQATALSQELLQLEPFKSQQAHIRIRALAVPSRQSGPDDPRAGHWSATPMGSSFNTLGIDRYLETEETWLVYDHAAQLPHDHIIVLVNSDKYGGGGIYNHFSVVSGGHRYSGRVMIHELGHGLGGLGDEYYGAEVAYNEFINLEIEPWQPNLTTLVDFDQKWKQMLEPSTPVPTPVRPMYQNTIGAFEGGGYVAKGVYRPALNCRMRTNEAKGFCAVCRHILTRKILFYAQ